MATKTMSDAAKAKRNEYARAWYAKNREKVRANINRHWEKLAARDAGAQDPEAQGVHLE